VLDNDQAMDRAHSAHLALRAIADAGDPCPPDADRFDFCADVLDELSRAALAISAAHDTLVDDPDDAVRETTEHLVTAIVRRRNALLREHRRARRATVVPGS
jgi:hypothetical protein